MSASLRRRSIATARTIAPEFALPTQVRLTGAGATLMGANLMGAELIGWFAAAILLATVGRQVYSQWRQGTSQGVSKWLFIGQMAASAGFIAYSWLLTNWVFVVTNVLMLATALVGQWIHLRNKHRPQGPRR